MIGKLQLLVKVYPDGLMSQHLKNLPMGSTIDFKHVEKNVKIQYPFIKKHVTMLAGGSGITPMIQALHAILGTPGDTTQVTMIFSNKSQEDILCKDLLDAWSREYADRCKVVHLISSEEHANCLKIGGLIEKHSAPPEEDVLLMVCGPPDMYTHLCGPREDLELTGLLKQMGYRAEQVVKF